MAVVIVCGMHRSGTSALAGLLHSNGVIMGEDENFYPKANRYNEKGYYENVLFRNMNDEILESNGYTVKGYNNNIPNCIFDESKLKSLIDKYNKKYSLWGWKDPRNCLTLHLWLRCIDNPKVVVVRRDYLAISKSMINRGNKGDINKFTQLCYNYYDKLYDSLNNIEYLDIDFTELLNNTDVSYDKLSNYIGIDIKNKHFIDSNLVHN
jgi:hypothetical protein